MRKTSLRGWIELFFWLGILSLILLVAVIFSPSLFGQNIDNSQYVKQYLKPHGTVADAVTAAQNACNPDTSIPCIIVFDPSLVKYTSGTLPAKCIQCQWLDYRAGLAYVLSAGGVMTGTLSGPGYIGPVTGSVTGHASADLPLTGGTLIGALNVPFANNICKADQQSGSDACTKMEACNTTLVALGGGTIDARGFGATTQLCTINTATNPLAIGAASAPVNLDLDRLTYFQITATGGGDAVQLYSKSVITCEGGSQGIGGMYLGASSSVSTLITSYPHNTSNTITSYRHCTFGSISGATVTDAVGDIWNPTDETVLENDIWDCHAIGYCLQGSQNGAGGAGNLYIKNNSVDCNGAAGCHPARFIWNSGGIFGAIGIDGGAWTHPGAGGIPIVDFEGCTGSDSALTGIHIFGEFQMESSQAADIGVKLNCVHGAIIDGLMTTNGTGGAGTTAVEIDETAGTSSQITIRGINNFGQWSHTINDTVNSFVQGSADWTDYQMPQYPTGGFGTIVGIPGNTGVKKSCTLTAGCSYHFPMSFLNGVTVGASNHTFNRHSLVSCSIATLSAVPANSCAAQSQSCSGILTGDVVTNGSAAKPTFQAGLSLTGALVTGTGTVSLNFCNVTAASITPTAGETYSFDVEQ